VTITGTIASIIMPGVYQVIDGSGRKYKASSGTAYRNGDRVTVMNGIIVGVVAGNIPSSPTVKIYEV